MGLDTLDVRLDARNLDLQGFDTLLELLDRHRVEILSGQLDQRVTRLAREEVVEIHDG